MKSHVAFDIAVGKNTGGPAHTVQCQIHKSGSRQKACLARQKAHVAEDSASARIESAIACEPCA